MSLVKPVSACVVSLSTSVSFFVGAVMTYTFFCMLSWRIYCFLGFCVLRDLFFVVVGSALGCMVSVWLVPRIALCFYLICFFFFNFCIYCVYFDIYHRCCCICSVFFLMLEFREFFVVYYLWVFF